MTFTIERTMISPPCAICGRTNVKRFPYTLNKGNHSQKLYACRDCHSRKDFRNKLSEAFSILTPVNSKVVSL